MNHNQEDIRFLIRLYHELSRFQESLHYIEILSVDYPCFSFEDLNLMTVVVKEAVDPLRHTIRTLNSYYNNEIEDNNPEKSSAIREHQQKFENELLSICHKVISIIDDRIFPNTPNSLLERAYCYKIIGDMNRYIIESHDISEIEKAKIDGEKAYEESIKIYSHELSVYSPINLHVILNYSVFIFEHLGKKEKAIEILQNALDYGIPSIEELNIDAEEYNQIISALSVMKTNLISWKS
ncbi:14-3-3 protein like protein [Tritrichomonas foetus]|uniref:14-3-3 protein like protein n=1 Tax=Tritrichomonas foetus TaxID=1144522 RepID=A0A1J4JJ35_9EUKA|nr:14-3-3 protein like protein [Tritrichomonas foetus]|eukprot:OHS97236.1 14-3-3 protein like protein [Tritrichomonas foetus]